MEKWIRVQRGWEFARRGESIASWARHEGVSVPALIQTHKTDNPDLWKMFEDRSPGPGQPLLESMQRLRSILLVGVEMGCWTQTAVANALQVSPSTLSQYRKRNWNHEAGYLVYRDMVQDTNAYYDYLTDMLCLDLNAHSIFEADPRVGFYHKRQTRIRLLEDSNYVETFEYDDKSYVQFQLRGTVLMTMQNPYIIDYKRIST